MEQKKYNIIYADPPWTYRVYSSKGNGRSAASHYPVMELEAIKALPVEQLAEKDCTLFLWVTFPNLRESFEVIEAGDLPLKRLLSCGLSETGNRTACFGAWDIGLVPMRKSACLLQKALQSGNLLVSIR